MHRLLKTELIYYSRWTSAVLLLSALVFVTIWAGVKWERNRIPMTMLLILALAIAAAHSGEMSRNIQKRDRLHVLLPVSLRQIGIFHLLYPLMILGGIYCVYFLAAAVFQVLADRPPTMLTVSHGFTLFGMVLIYNAVLLLFRDLNSTVSQHPRKSLLPLLWLLIYLTALLPFYVITNFLGIFGENTPLQKFLSRMIAAPLGFVAAGLLLSGISLLVFCKRESYAA